MILVYYFILLNILFDIVFFNRNFSRKYDFFIIFKYNYKLFYSVWF